jgi:hypothetical protein
MAHAPRPFPTRVARAVLAAAMATLAAMALAQPREQQVFLDGPIPYRLPDGSTRVLQPSCSNGPFVDASGTVQAADPQYSFFIQEGDPRKLLLFMDGGGGCWEAQTCLASPLRGTPTYRQTVDETVDTESGGLFNDEDPRNPYLGYTRVFVPYCTGDFFWGARDTEYVLDGPGLPPLTWTIRHRGADNLLAVLDWLQNHAGDFGFRLSRVRDLTVAGSSAGAYGAAFALPYVAERAPRARLRLLADAGVGVFNEAFVRTALRDPDVPGSGSWGVSAVLPAFAGVDDGLLAAAATDPLGLIPAWYARLSAHAPQARLGMVTSHFDELQIRFFTVMERLAGRLDSTDAIAADWYLGMAAITDAAEALPNYRSHVEAGVHHVILADDLLYYEPGPSGVAVRDWNRAMISRTGRGWRNVDVGPPPGLQARPPPALRR